MRPRAFKSLEVIKRDYLARLGTLQELATRYNIPYRTVLRYSALQKWQQQRDEIGTSVVEVVALAAKEQAQETGKRAARFVERSIDDAEGLLDHVQQMLAKGQLDAGDFRQLVAAWQDVVRTGRQAFGMDQPQPQHNPVMVVTALQDMLIRTPVIDVESSGE
jgi:tape measure domain-containing protein